MNLNLTRWQVKRIYGALFLAAEWEETVIDSYSGASSSFSEGKRASREKQKYLDLRKVIGERLWGQK